MDKRVTLNVSLTRELGDLVTAKVASGRYVSASEVVREGLRLLDSRDREHEAGLASLRGQVEEGWQQLARGEVVPSDVVFGDLRSRLALPTRGE